MLKAFKKVIGFTGIVQKYLKMSRHHLGRFGPDNFEALRRANQALLDVKARMEPTREVWLDFNDTVVTLFGHQEGAEVGYNPRYRGRPSHKIKVAFVAGTVTGT